MLNEIANQVKFLENLGYEVFKTAKKFMEEYSELNICDRFVVYKNSIGESYTTTCIKDLFAHIPNKEIEKYDLDEEVGQKTIPVLIGGEMVYISEDVKFYNDQGLANYNNYEL